MPALLPSEQPIRAEVRQHWIVLIRVKHWQSPLLVAAAVALGFLWSFAWWVVGIIVVGVYAYRVREWRAERIVLTGKRLIHVSGTVETTTSEASLRVDRVSGLDYVRTPLGWALGYGNVVIEAPGDHPRLHRLYRISDPSTFYDELRWLVYGEPGRPDPDFPDAPRLPSERDTAPLPRLAQDTDEADGRPRLRRAFRRD